MRLAERSVKNNEKLCREGSKFNFSPAFERTCQRSSTINRSVIIVFILHDDKKRHRGVVSTLLVERPPTKVLGQYRALPFLCHVYARPRKI